MKIKKLLLTFSLTVLFVLPLSAFALEDDKYASNQYVVTAPEAPREDSAYILFGEKEEMRSMSYIEPGNAGRFDELYSEKAEFNGITGRQVYVENYFYFKIDPSFADENDRVFSISLDYWDYGGGGSFYVEYLPRGGTDYKSVEILKLGLDENNKKTQGTWFHVTMYIDDACFTGEMPYGADFRIRSGAYNTFSKVEVRNLSRSAGENEDIANFNLAKANALNKLGMFDGFGSGDEFEPSLDKVLTREEALVQLIKSYGMEEEALNKNLHTSFSDVSMEAAPYVALAENLGVLTSGEKLGANETFAQKELLCWYLRLLGVNETEIENDPYTAAWNNELLSRQCMIFQPGKTVTVDEFVILAFNAFAMENIKTGYCPFTTLFEKGVYNVQTIADVNDQQLWSWLEQNPFTINYETRKDPYSGRTYSSIGFLGQSARKAYYTQNCMSMDGNRIYFATDDYKVYEYNLTTQQCKYIGEVMTWLNKVVTPLDNLWYLNKRGEIMKVDLDTYEQTVMGKLPEWQKSSPFMMQVNNDESKVSFQWSDTSGDFDSTKYSRIPVFDVATQTWDLRFWWGFETPRYLPDHQCINPNPKYSNYVFFAHDESATDRYTGERTPQYDRIWMTNTDTGEIYNFFEQKWYIEPVDNDPLTGFSGEGCVHEAWTNDGEWMVFVKNKNAKDGIERQIGFGKAVMMRPDGSDKRYIPADYTFTHANNGHSADGMVHCMVSNDSRWIVADSTYNSSKGWSDMYLVDSYSGATYFLGRISQQGSDPGHIHPQFSPDDQSVIFGLWDDDKTHGRIGWMDVSDIVNNPPEGGRYAVSSSVETFGYEGFDHYVIPQYSKDGQLTGIKVPEGNKMYVDVKKEIIESDNTPATVSVTYLDDTKHPLKLSYYTWDVNYGTMPNELAKHVVNIERKGTGKVMTKTFNFDDICLGNMEILGSDFTISAVGADATIISVDVIVPKEEK